jgi:hypothetical protein
MRAAISKANATEEFAIPEGCFILDTSNTDDDPGLSVARARVPPGVTTACAARASGRRTTATSNPTDP